MILIGRKLLATGCNRLLIAEATLISEAPWLLIAQASSLLSKRALLLLILIELSGGSADVGVADQRARRVGTAQQHVLLIHLWVVDELPLVIRLLLVVDPDGRVLVHAGYSNNRAASELPAQALHLAQPTAAIPGGTRVTGVALVRT